MSEHLEVVIDGVKYVPADVAVANSMAIKRGLLEQFWGEVEPEEVDEKWSLVRLAVADSLVMDGYDDAWDIDEVLQHIAKYMEKKE